MISFEIHLIGLLVLALLGWFFRSSRVALRKPDAGTVYFVKADPNSWFHKVGMTIRPFRERKQELEGTHNDGNRMHEVAVIRNMPFAWDVEQYFHKRISRTQFHMKGRRYNPNTRDRGKEFYVLKKPDDVEFVLATLERAAKEVCRVAKTPGPLAEGR